MNFAIVGADQDTVSVPISHRDRTKGLLAAAIEHYLTGQSLPPELVADGPWDAWWACYRAQRTATQLGLTPGRAAGSCPACAADAAALASAIPPEHPGHDPRDCSCLSDWATSMRRPAPELRWPPWRLTIGMVKPGGDPAIVRDLLADTHTVLDTVERSLTPDDVRRIYPDAYGASYVARQDDYLTSAPATVFVLLAHPAAAGNAKDIKADVRGWLGGGDLLRNHLHMPDSPGDAFADLDHLAGTEVLTALYERHERDRAADRMARYRALLDQRDPRPRAG